MKLTGPDIGFTLGLALLASGCYLWWVPASLIVPGGVLTCVSLLGYRPAAKESKNA